MEILLLSLFATLFILGYLMYAIADEEWYIYKYQSKFYEFVAKYDPIISRLGIGIMVVSGLILLIVMILSLQQI